MSTFRDVRASTTLLLCAPLLFLDCQSRLTSIALEEVDASVPLSLSSSFRLPTPLPVTGRPSQAFLFGALGAPPPTAAIIPSSPLACPVAFYGPMTASTGERVLFLRSGHVWGALLLGGSTGYTPQCTLPVFSSGRVGSFLSRWCESGVSFSRTRVHVLFMPHAPHRLCVYLGKVGLLGGMQVGGTSGELGAYNLRAQAFGPASWCAHFGVAVGDLPSLPSDIDEILDSPCPFWFEQKVRDTHVLVLVPSEVDGVPYTLDKLGELIRLRLPKNLEGYRYHGANVQTHLGAVPPQAPCWVLLTHNVIPGSRNQRYEDQKKMLADHAARTGLAYCLPSVLEVSTALLTHYVRSGERLLADDPWTYTRCQDLVMSGGKPYPVAVGGFSSSGFASSGFYVVHDFYNSHYHYYGVLGCRKFF